MKIAIAVLTWNRLPALSQIAADLVKHCHGHKLAVFEDAGIQDTTVAWILDQCKGQPQESRLDLEALKTQSMSGIEYYLGTDNLGVAGNTNRIFRWFLASDCDYLCVCNDDLIVKGDFASFYAKAWESTGIGLLCFCGFTSKAFAWDEVEYKGFTVKKLGRMTGAMLGMPRKLIETIGYFDMRFGKFGEEHVDFTNRARLSGFQDIDGKPYSCLDVKHDMLQHMEIPSTLSNAEKEGLNIHAANALKTVNYEREGFYRPFALNFDVKVGATDNNGSNMKSLVGYYNVDTKEVLK